jgi:hypothetical protein
MCFSATASFTASVTLAIIGLLACKQAKQRATFLLAFSPLIFALQQASEGVLWLSFTHPAWQLLQTPATYFFLFCALAWWPFWIPLTLTLLEPHVLQRKILLNLLTFGAFFSLYMLFCIGSYGASASITNCQADICHMHYAIQIPGDTYSLSAVLYLIPAVLPFFVSSIWGMQTLGASISLAYLVSYMFYQTHFLSVWCFFAAILSLWILIIVRHIERQR